METGTTYIFPTGAGWLHVVRIGDTIFAFCEGEEPLVHRVPAPSPEQADWDPDGAEMPVSFASLGREQLIGLAVGRVAHPTDTRIAFYDAVWKIGWKWGYVWDIDYPERSYWAPSERLADMIDPDDVPQESSLSYLIDELITVTARTELAHPRATAVAAASSGSLKGMMATVATLRSWLVDLQTALDELEAQQILTPHQ